MTSIDETKIESRHDFPKCFDKEDGEEVEVLETVEETVETVEETPKKKVKRLPSAYNIFVKEHIGDFKNLPAKERMKAVGNLWKESKSK